MINFVNKEKNKEKLNLYKIRFLCKKNIIFNYILKLFKASTSLLLVFKIKIINIGCIEFFTNFMITHLRWVLILVESTTDLNHFGISTSAFS